MINIEKKQKLLKKQKEKEWEKQYMIFSEYLTIEEMKTIEKWTKLKCSSIIFNSLEDDWKQKKRKGNTLKTKIEKKSNLFFLIQDKNKNK